MRRQSQGSGAVPVAAERNAQHVPCSFHSLFVDPFRSGQSGDLARLLRKGRRGSQSVYPLRGCLSHLFQPSTASAISSAAPGIEIARVTPLRVAWTWSVDFPLRLQGRLWNTNY